jgi:hypothetical protein
MHSLTLAEPSPLADMPLLAYIFERALDAHPKSQELLVLHLVFLRFVFRDVHSAVYKEKISKTLSSELRIDLKYTLYAGEGGKRAGGGGEGCCYC